MGMLRHFVAADSPAAVQSVAGWAGRWLIADRWEQSVALQPPSCAACRRLYMNRIIIWPLPIRSTGV